MLFRSPAHVVRDLPRSFSENTQIQAEDRAMCIADLDYIRKDCEGLGLNVTLTKVNRFMTKLMSQTLTFRQMEVEARDIFERLTDELDSRIFLAIDNKHVPYYEQYNEGWEGVLNRFPSAAQDIEEASKCLALNRYTAVVFHLMRVMETGLGVVAATLNDPSIDPKSHPNWQFIINRFQNELKKAQNQRAPEWQADEPFWSGVAVRLAAVKDAWRNPVMHVRGKYTEEEALDVWNHVQSFMRHLSTKLSE